MVKWYDRIGNTIEMRVGRGWIKGTVIDGERTGDGIVNMETAEGRKYWCGVGTEGVYFKKCDDSVGDLITNADHIRSFSDEELAEFLIDHHRYPCKYCSGCPVECSDGLMQWLKSEVKE